MRLTKSNRKFQTKTYVLALTAVTITEQCFIVNVIVGVYNYSGKYKSTGKTTFNKF